MRLSPEDIQHLRTGALFLACAVDPEWCEEQTQRIVSHMAKHGTEAEVRPVTEFSDDALIAAVGFVNNGLPLSELRPAGDEFATSVRLLEKTLGRRIEGLMPLAAANINAMVPVLTGMQMGLPIVDADPMGRVFPLLFQSVFTLAGLTVGPIAATGPTGESALINVDEPARGEKLVRALAAEFGGWSATALYPMEARSVAQHGLVGSVSRLVEIGQIVDSPLSTVEKQDALRRTQGVRRIIRARVSDVAGLSRPAPPGHPDRPSSVFLVEETQNRIVQIEIHNELLMVMVDGAVEAIVPDIITMMQPDDGRVASLNDLWVGNTVDIVILPGDRRWYTPEGLVLAAPTGLHGLPREWRRR